jgi:hypothetical protein
MKFFVILSAILVASCTHLPPVPPVPDPPCDPGIVYFTNEILPMIQSNCAMSGCHSSTNPADGIDLSSYAGIRSEVRAGNPDESELYQVLFESGEDLMPPPPMAPLTDAQKERIRLWILQGAKKTTCIGDCDTAAVTTYSGSIAALIQTQCIGCHQGPTASGGVQLTNYSQVSSAVSYLGLLEAINATSVPTAMPPSGPMTNCNVALIERWVRGGMPQ